MTRNPKRISKVLDLIEEYWEENPDLRLGQIIANAAHVMGTEVYNIDEYNLLRGIDKLWEMSVKKSHVHEENQKEATSEKKSEPQPTLDDFLDYAGKFIENCRPVVKLLDFFETPKTRR